VLSMPCSGSAHYHGTACAGQAAVQEFQQSPPAVSCAGRMIAGQPLDLLAQRAMFLHMSCRCMLPDSTGYVWHAS
jgi:hypothetical protein